MKHGDLTPWLVLMADQRDSRHAEDLVPAALSALAPLSEGMELPFERTTGDELQGLTRRPEIITAAVVTLTRLGHWRVGIGIGDVEQPLPSSTRQARGSAYLAARDAIDASRRLPTFVSLKSYGGDQRDAYRAETAFILLRSLLNRRTYEGWELMDLLDAGLNGRQAAERLGISGSAVSQRQSAAGREEGLRGADLATELLRLAIGENP